MLARDGQGRTEGPHQLEAEVALILDALRAGREDEGAVDANGELGVEGTCEPGAMEGLDTSRRFLCVIEFAF